MVTLSRFFIIGSLLLWLNSCNKTEPSDFLFAKRISNQKLHVPKSLDYLKKYSRDSLLCSGFDFPVGNVDGKGPYTSSLDGKTYDSWQVSVPFGIYYSLGIHPGDDWGGTGPSDSDLGQPVYAVSKGVVVYADDYDIPWGNIAMIRHVYPVKDEIDTVFSVYIHLKDMYVRAGQIVQRRDSIGTIGDGGVYRPHLHFEIRKSTMKDYGANYWPSSDGKTMEWVKKNYLSPGKFIRKNRHF